MKSMSICVVAIGVGWSGVAVADSSASSSSSGNGGNVTTSTGNDRDCEIVHKPASARGSGPLSSTVTAGPNGVSGATTNGSDVQVHAGGGSVSSSTSGDGQSVTTDSNGHCTVTIFDKDR